MLLLILCALTGFQDGKASEHLNDFAFLVGKDWITTFPDGKTTDTQRFEWLYDGKFLRNLHWVKSGDGKVMYEGETIYAWDYAKQRIVWYYFNTTGGHLVGFLKTAKDGYEYEAKNIAPTGQTSEVRGGMKFDNDSTFRSITYFKRGEEWQVQRSSVYKPVE